MMMSDYPKVKYSKDGYTVVQSKEEEGKLAGSWSDKPVGKADDNGFVASGESVGAPVQENPVTLQATLPPNHTYHDRLVFQAQNAGIKIDKRWSDETLMRKIQELQPLGVEVLTEVNADVPTDKELDEDPTVSNEDRDTQSKIDAAVAEALAAKK
jgi:hypothetical protein